MKQTLQLKLGQHLTMTPQLQQAIKLLQLSALDLQQEIQDALDSNLMLEPAPETPSTQSEVPEKKVESQDTEVNISTEQLPDELPTDSNWEDTYEPIINTTGSKATESADFDMLAQRSAATTLHDHLSWQQNLAHFSDTDSAIATALIDSIDDKGYLRTSVEDILSSFNDDLEEDEQLDELDILAVLHRIQTFDPAGVGAQTPQECLLLQLKQLPEETPWLAMSIKLLTHYFELISSGQTKAIIRKMGISDNDLSQCMKLIRTLNPHPGSQISDQEAEYIVPDVIVSKKNGHWTVTLNAEAMPRLRVSSAYSGMIKRADNSSDNQYLKSHLQEARWFLKSLQSRQETLLHVAESIVRNQQNFFEYGDEAMKPMILRDVAEELEMHESTISRSTTQKYMRTPRGTYEFKYFFSSHVSTSAGGECSATAIRALMKKLISAELPGKPLSDNKIATILSEQGIKVARRTVAKYRESMSIPPSNERKRIA